MMKVRNGERHRNGHLTPLPLLDHIDRARVRALPLAARRLLEGGVDTLVPIKVLRGRVGSTIHVIDDILDGDCILDIPRRGG